MHRSKLRGGGSRRLSLGGSLFQVSVSLYGRFELQRRGVLAGDLDVVYGDDPGQSRQSAYEFPELVIGAPDADFNRQLGIEVFGYLSEGLKQLELKPCRQTRLGNVDKKGSHLRLVGQLAQHGAQGFGHLSELLLVGLEARSFFLLLFELGSELLLFVLHGVELGDLILSIEVVPGSADDCTGECHSERFGKGGPFKKVTEIEAIELS